MSSTLCLLSHLIFFFFLLDICYVHNVRRYISFCILGLKIKWEKLSMELHDSVTCFSRRIFEFIKFSPSCSYDHLNVTHDVSCSLRSRLPRLSISPAFCVASLLLFVHESQLRVLPNSIHCSALPLLVTSVFFFSLSFCVCVLPSRELACVCFGVRERGRDGW